MTRAAGPILFLLCCVLLNACTADRPRDRVVESDQPRAVHATRTLSSFPEQTFSAQLRLHNGHLYTRAHINEQDVGWFIFDTGAAIHTVSPGVAGRLELDAVGGGTVRGIGGVERFDFHPIDSLRVGDADLDVQRLAGVQVDLLRGGFGIKPAGLLGFSAFKGRPFTVDVQRQMLIVHPLRAFTPPAGAEVTSMSARRGIPVVMITVGRHRVPVILDTGQDAELVLPLALLKKDPAIASVPVTGRGRAAGVGGIINTTLTWTKTVKLLGTTLGDVPTTFEPDPPGGIGRVGLSLLKHFELTFDPQRQRVISTWRPLDQ